jgi:transposase
MLKAELTCKGEFVIMKDTTKYIGLDVSKETIAVAVADEGREAPRFWGTIRNTNEAVQKLMKQLGNSESLQVCYEAGPTGYPLHRWLTVLGISCTVVAPSLTPQRPGDRVKTDRRDAIRLAQLFRSGELTGIYVPTEEDEALRDLVRARESVKEDQHRARQRLGKFLLRHNIFPPQKLRRWTVKYMTWLQSLSFTSSSLKLVMQENLQQLNEIAERLKRLEAAIHDEATEGKHAPLIKALQCLRGVAEITATTLVSEVCMFGRFMKAKAFMGYTGLVPSERSSGETRWQGKTTKTGNTHVRRVLVEAAWSYRYQPALKGELKKRQEGRSAEIQAMAWKAQHRLHKKYQKMLSRGKPSGKAMVGIARELSGFVWAIACQIENEQNRTVV